jgi:hypothetical protein
MLTALTLTHHVEAFGTRGELAGTATPGEFLLWALLICQRIERREIGAPGQFDALKRDELERGGD